METTDFGFEENTTQFSAEDWVWLRDAALLTATSFTAKPHMEQHFLNLAASYGRAAEALCEAQGVQLPPPNKVSDPNPPAGSVDPLDRLVLSLPGFSLRASVYVANVAGGLAQRISDTEPEAAELFESLSGTMTRRAARLVELTERTDISGGTEIV